MKQLTAIAINAFKVTIGDPFFLVLHLTALILLLLLGTIPGFTFGEHVRLLRDQCQALIFMIACLAIIFGFIRVITDDVRRGADPILRSRPISAFSLIMGRWIGVVSGVYFLFSSAIISYLWVSEIAFNSEYLNIASLIIYLSVILLALGASALRHYLFGGSYVFHANLALTLVISTSLLIQVLYKGNVYYDWPALQSSSILGIALLSFSAVLLPVTLLVDSVMVLSIGIALFFIGLVSDYLISIMFSSEFFSTFFKSIIPNWQIYWVADRLSEGHGIPLGYFATCATQSSLLLVVYGVVAVLLYERTEFRHSE